MPPHKARVTTPFAESPNVPKSSLYKFGAIGCNSSRIVKIAQESTVTQLITAVDSGSTHASIPSTNASMPFSDGSQNKNVPCSVPDERDNGSSGTQGLGTGQGSGAGNDDNFSGASRRGGDRKNSSTDGFPPVVSEDQMKKEEQRIKSFNKWPHTFLTPTILAAAGFYHVRDDLVRCAFCKIEIVKWESGDIPWKEHKRWSANCPLVRGVPCGNVPIGDNSSSHGSANGIVSDDSLLAYDTCGIHEEMRPFSFCDDERPSTSSALRSKLPIERARYDGDEEKEPSIEPSLEKLGVRDIRGPVHPDFSTEAARFASYSSWPVAIKQRPKILAEAGFYYTGNGDQTICFHCGGGLRDWEEGDDPWIEHAKWFSRCDFLNLVKGSDFVSQVTETRPAVMNAEEAKGLSQSSISTLRPEPAKIVTSMPVPVESEPNKACSVPSTSQGPDNVREPTAVKEIKDDVRLCKICYASELGVVFLPCGHMVACVKCVPSLAVCPVCRQKFTHTVRAFIP